MSGNPPISSINFSPYFRSREINFKSDLELMDCAWKLRFSVYCLECKFLPDYKYSDFRERDKHDLVSGHFCAINTLEDMVGYVRLVRPDERQRLPFQDHCAAIDLLEDDVQAQSAEISRLMVREDYRRRRGDIVSGVTVEDRLEQPRDERRKESPQILLSLYRQMYIYSLQNRIRYWYAAMERPLARALNRMGFPFLQVGPQTDYYGPVAPYRADLRELESQVARENPDLMQWLRRASFSDPSAPTA